MQTCIILAFSAHTGIIPVWAVFFMKKLMKRVIFCLLLAALVWCGTLISDRQRLNEELIRLHVVAASDSVADQSLKLQVRDAVVDSLREAMEDIGDAEQAKIYLQENLAKIEKIANCALMAAGCDDSAKVTLVEESFGKRGYETFRLPAGVYSALRITIGEGNGSNWWCVVFPTLCEGATTEEFADIAAGAGFPDSLSGALQGEAEYEIRFFLLDVLGRLENLLHGG